MNTLAKRPREARLLWVALPVLLLLAGTWLRAAAVWTSTPFDVDEALYASFSRQISHENNSLLIDLPVDKPPLSFYTGAFSFKLFGTPSEWAARLPGFFASILSLAILRQLVWTLYRNRIAAFLGMAFLVCSSLDIAYAGTAFTDAQTTLWTLAALLAVAKTRWGSAGLFLGLAFATKQSAIVTLPLVLAIGWTNRPPRSMQLVRFGIMLGLTLSLPFLWDLTRTGTASGWWALGAANNAPDRFVYADALIPRLTTWISYLSSSAGNWVMLAWTAITSIVLVVTRFAMGQHSRRHALDGVWLVFVWGYIAAYALIAFNTYPRYAHLLSPILALLAARSLTARPNLAQSGWTRTGIILIALLVVIPNAARHRTEPSWLVDAQQQHTGIEAVARYLNTQAPGTIVYDHWTGWLLGWYVGQRRPPDMWLRVVYYPTPEALVQDALAQPDPQHRFFVAPIWAPVTPWVDVLDTAGFAPEIDQQNGQFRVYRLIPPD